MLPDELPDADEDAGLTREDVERRVDDWLNRLRDLLGVVERWAMDNGWAIESRDAVPMHEELMQHFGVAQREQPGLTLRDRAGDKLLLRPKGLWVIGANGRVDLFTKRGAFVLIDAAEPFSAPNWRLFKVGGGHETGRDFDPSMLSEMV
eukprot:g985.t1